MYNLEEMELIELVDIKRRLEGLMFSGDTCDLTSSQQQLLNDVCEELRCKKYTETVNDHEEREVGY